MKRRTRKTSNKDRLQSILPRSKKQVREFEMLGGAAMLIVLVFIGFFFLLTSLHNSLMSSPQIAAVVSSVLVDLTNGDRAANNLGTLKVNPQLVAIAQAKANDMAAKGYFSHISPEGHDPWYWFKRGDYAFEYAGENLAVDFTDSGEVERAWMNSPSHRKNILDPNFTEIGIATAVGTYQGRTTIFVAQAFGKPSEEEVQAPIQVATVPDAPTETAIAQAPARAEQAVLGSSVAQTSETPPVSETSQIEPAVAAELAVEATESKPAWSALIAMPRDTLRNAYFLIGILILIGLAIDTGLEIRRHHQRRALRVAAVLVVMATLFTFAEIFYFVEPVIALGSGSL